jgi:tRNA (guanine-N7-)-methyltransferase
VTPHPRRRSAWADRLLEFGEFVFSDGAELTRRGRWREFFGDHIGSSFDGRVIFEIGCNDASLLARVAAKHPSTAFVGIDWKCRALYDAAKRVAAADLKNVAFLHGRAQDVRRFFGDEELDEAWLFHPDPCDKPRELAHRLFSPPFLLDLHATLRTGAVLVLKTDHREYHEHALAVVQNEPTAGHFGVVADSFDFWNDEPARNAARQRLFAEESTFFEDRFRRKRKPIHYLELRKIAESRS